MDPTPLPPPIPNAPPPIGVTVLGWIMLAFGAFALLCSPFTIATPYWTAKIGQVHSPEYSRYLVIVGLFSIPFGALQAAAGFGLLRARRWSRLTAMAWAVVGIVFTLVNTPVSYLLVSRDPAVNNSPAWARSFSVSSSSAGGVMGILLPIAVLVVLTRPVNKAWLASRPRS